MSTLLSRAPCAVCKQDQLFRGQQCFVCGTALTLLPIELVYDGRRTQRNPDGTTKARPKALTTAQRKQRWREKNKRRAQQNRDRKRASSAAVCAAGVAGVAGAAGAGGGA